VIGDLLHGQAARAQLTDQRNDRLQEDLPLLIRGQLPPGGQFRDGVEQLALPSGAGGAGCPSPKRMVQSGSRIPSYSASRSLDRGDRTE
jgi:hypothetical protein